MDPQQPIVDLRKPIQPQFLRPGAKTNKTSSRLSNVAIRISSKPTTRHTFNSKQQTNSSEI